jgi:hypothetical protein
MKDSSHPISNKRELRDEFLANRRDRDREAFQMMGQLLQGQDGDNDRDETVVQRNGSQHD